MNRLFPISCFCLVFLSSVASADWPRFRGPNGSGVSDEAQQLPTEWSPTSKPEMEDTAARSGGVESDCCR